MIQDLWYKNAIIYSVHVGTYMDSNGDGIGDFEGLSRRLDYLHGMGINCIWLGPFQKSPRRDDGYDVSDYYQVDPCYGTMGDFVDFTSGRPWLPVSSDYEIVNVAAEQQDPKSMLALYTRLIALRQAEPALQVGSFRIFETAKDVFAEVLAYFRDDGFLVALNLGGRPQRVPLPRGGAVVLSTHLDRADERVGETLQLRPDEGLILRLTH